MAVSVTGIEAEKYATFNKCKSVIKSCVNISQLNGAERYVNLFCDIYQDPLLAIFLDDMIEKRVIERINMN